MEEWSVMSAEEKEAYTARFKAAQEKAETAKAAAVGGGGGEVGGRAGRRGADGRAGRQAGIGSGALPSA